MNIIRAAFCLWLSCLTIQATATDIIRVVPTEFNARDTASVFIELQNESLVNGYNFILSYDATILTAVEVEALDRSFSFSDSEGFEFAEGQISFVGFDRDANNLIAETGFLFNVKFVSVDPNAFREEIDTELSIDQFSFANADLELIPFESVPASISIIPTSNEYEESVEVPLDFKLYQNYPNPFNPTTTIQFDLPSSSNVTLVIYDILGREIERLYDDEELTHGKHAINFEAGRLASGMYLYKIIATPVTGIGIGHTGSGKMVLVK